MGRKQYVRNVLPCEMLSYNSSSEEYGSTITKTADREKVCLDPTFLIQSALHCASLQDRPVRTRNVIFAPPHNPPSCNE
jgi:hypothetical protein